MRQINIFRTTKRDHPIPRDIMIRALRLSPGKQWDDKRTKAYEYIKDWALAQDERIDGKHEKPKWEGENTITDEDLKNKIFTIPPGPYDGKKTKKED